MPSFSIDIEYNSPCEGTHVALARTRLGIVAHSGPQDTQEDARRVLETVLISMFLGFAEEIGVEL